MSARTTTRTVVTITGHRCDPISGEWLRVEWTHTARTSDEYEAIRRAIRRHWGPRASFHREAGMHGRYGQVVEPVPGNPGGYNCLTARVRIDVEAGS